jgi:hypothetical protein
MERWIAYHEIFRVVRFIIDTKVLKLKIEPKIEVDLVVNSESRIEFYGTYHVFA